MRVEARRRKIVIMKIQILMLILFKNYAMFIC